MADTTILFSLCPRLVCEEGDSVFFFLKDPTVLASNTGLSTPKYYLIEAVVTTIVQQNCSTCYYTFTYDDSVLVSGSTLVRSNIDSVEVFDSNTQYIKEVIYRNNLT